MRLVRFYHNKQRYWGILEDDYIKILNKPPFPTIVPLKQKIPLHRARLLAPAQASKVVLVGLNYRNHAKELKMKAPKAPIIFLKPPTAIIGHNANIIYPEGVKRLDYEAELAIVIKKKAKNIDPKSSGKHILGYTCLNDVTARDLQRKDGQWTRAKSFDTFCPIGPWIETSIDTSNLKIKTFLNGQLKQDSCTKHFIFKVDFLVSFISTIMTLLPGDIIATGTPPGIGPMKRGDTV